MWRRYYCETFDWQLTTSPIYWMVCVRGQLWPNIMSPNIWNKKSTSLAWGNQFHIQFIKVNCTIFVSELKLTDFTEFWLNKQSNSAFDWSPHLRQESHISCALCGRFHEDWRAAVSVASLSRLSCNWWKRIEGVCSLSLLKLSSYSLSLYRVSIVIQQNLSLCSAKFQHTE